MVNNLLNLIDNFMKKAVIIIGVLVLVGIGVGFLFWGNNSSPANPPTEETDSAPTSVSTPAPVPTEASSSAGSSAPQAAKEFIVTGQNFSFAPSTITVKQGDRVRIMFKNAGGTHDLRLDEFNVATKRIQGGEQDSVEFVADKAGSFEYYCSVGSHRAMGMKGTLIVE